VVFVASVLRGMARIRRSDLPDGHFHLTVFGAGYDSWVVRDEAHLDAGPS
jgi:hypothetical protein